MKKSTQMIEQRRRAEVQYSLMERSLAEEKRNRDIAAFEVATTKRIDARTKQERFLKLKRDNEAALLERRRRLADLFNGEIAQWKYEISQMTETIEDRKARIMERAYALKNAREAAQQEYVEQAYKQLWRESCDDARTLDSKALDIYMNEERLRQIQEKKSRKIALSANENEWLKEWNRQLEAMSARDKAKEEYRAAKTREMVDGIKSQITYNNTRKANERANTRKEDEDEIAMIKKKLAEDHALIVAKQREAAEKGREILRFNTEVRMQNKVESQREAVEDRILLDHALRKEAEQIASEEAKKNSAKHAAAVYRRYLEEQMIKEAQDESALDAVRIAEEMKVWKARDDVMEARRLARENLMKLVDDGRKEQISYRATLNEAERLEGEEFARKFKVDAEIGMELEKREMLERRQKAIESNEVLKRQINDRRQRVEDEKQEVYLQDKQMQYMEKIHRKKLEEQAGNVRVNFPLTKNNWYT